MNFGFLHLSGPLDYPTRLILYVSHVVQIIEVLLCMYIYIYIYIYSLIQWFFLLQSGQDAIFPDAIVFQISVAIKNRYVITVSYCLQPCSIDISSERKPHFLPLHGYLC